MAHDSPDKAMSAPTSAPPSCAAGTTTPPTKSVRGQTAHEPSPAAKKPSAQPAHAIEPVRKLAPQGKPAAVAAPPKALAKDEPGQRSAAVLPGGAVHAIVSDDVSEGAQ
jgi:hypothetical protein